MCINQLFELATPLVSMVNPQTNAILRRPRTFDSKTDIAPDGNVNTFAKYEDFPVEIDVQAASSGDLQLINNIQQQGDIRKVFILGAPTALNRPLQKGADLLIFNNGSWLVTEIQPWDTGEAWAECLVTRQTDQQQSAI